MYNWIKEINYRLAKGEDWCGKKLYWIEDLEIMEAAYVDDNLDEAIRPFEFYRKDIWQD